ncbi:hypothetical protein GGH94_006009 [Coemansia aciculifera]|uniref:DUF647-domain-containing protein n=1 Tax=Coemansia aciculifera TaxID=417176 RepID=A0A9W8IKA5_9FUNG|nr:hypothetical protein GGH94_006009 [Coemansia aciculifera]KAJ2869896.1 hypothetical protein GGH93_005987 [Coemansia aciculifera]
MYCRALLVARSVPRRSRIDGAGVGAAQACLAQAFRHQRRLSGSLPKIGRTIVVRQGQLESTVAAGSSSLPGVTGRDQESLSPSLVPHMSHKFKISLNVIPERKSKVNDGTSEQTSIAGRMRQSYTSLMKPFLPADYKNTVTPEYIHYTKWQFVHNTLGSASGVLATQAMLYAMGLGAGALPLSAAINWVLKDGFGQLGGVIYATMVGQKFDSDPKHQRFWSAVWLQSATWLEMLTPLAPHLFLLIGSVANIGKNISWLAMSATKASINKTFCRKENLGDLTAKSGSQATAAGLLGTAVGVLIGATMDVSVYTLIVGFVPLSLISLWGNYKSLLYAITPTLNVERARLMIEDAVRLNDNGDICFEPAWLRTPRQVSEVETFMREVRNIQPNGQRPGITISPMLSHLGRGLPGGSHAKTQAGVAQMVNDAFNPPSTRQAEQYFIGYMPSSNTGSLYLWFSTHATNSDILKGFYHAMVYREMLAGGHKTHAATQGSVPFAELCEQSYEFSLRTFAEFCQSVTQRGWDIGTMYLSKSSRLVDVRSQQGD